MFFQNELTSIHSTKLLKVIANQTIWENFQKDDEKIETYRLCLNKLKNPLKRYLKCKIKKIEYVFLQKNWYEFRHKTY